MKNSLHKAAALAATLAIALVFCSAARAQSYPDKTIKIISPSPPGGGTDTATRLVTAKVTELAQWNFVVDTRPGAGGNIGLAAGATASADGYTLVMGETSNLTVNQYLYKSVPVDPEKQLAPVALVGTGPLVLVVGAAKPWRNLADVVAASKQNGLTYASSGSGTVGHLVSESFKKQSGAQLIHVPYKGAGPAMADMLGGQVDVYFSSLTAALPLIQSGKLKALAVTSAARVEALPNVPTLIEAGYPGLDYYVFYGVVAPARTPAAVVSALNREINRALATPDLKKGLADRGVFTQAGSPEAFGEFLKKERSKWQKIVHESGATVD
ncbi:tripartite tricarboxylate transporter substrate binding protein [Xylophilus rhododendri]|uniref:Tripartite tricarboxylate transporter substrate binding protein n=1 Tax=Xylophilus rhododendri TaxID=2697032 RepID=A0A857J666_9BURK|nr:tripartite tricarboxylate transporter substrate binding protein [Xylophilus rhododendri]QHI98491.1 tripartite tricarboxylate transporter substrate binding protein [Xylophilus rhododendri]